MQLATRLVSWLEPVALALSRPASVRVTSKRLAPPEESLLRVVALKPESWPLLAEALRSLATLPLASRRSQ